MHAILLHMHLLAHVCMPFTATPPPELDFDLQEVYEFKIYAGNDDGWSDAALLSPGI